MYKLKKPLSKSFLERLVIIEKMKSTVNGKVYNWDREIDFNEIFEEELKDEKR